MQDPYADPIAVAMTLSDAILVVQSLETLDLDRLEPGEQHALQQLYNNLHRVAFPTLEPQAITAA